MATCKEDTDDVEGPALGSDNASMSMGMSDDCTFDDGHDSGGTGTDSDTDSDTTKGRGIDVVIYYKTKIKKTIQDLKRHVHISLTLEKYLKWQYVMNNTTLRQHRMGELQKLVDKVAINSGILEVSLGRQKDPDIDSLSNTIEETVMSDTGSIIVSLYAMRSPFPSNEYYKVLEQVLQQSDLGQRFEVYTEMSASSKAIRIVHDFKHADRVAELFNKATKEIEKKVRSGWVSTTINLPMVYYQVFEKYGMKKQAGQVSQAVLVFLNLTESKDEFNVELRGPQNEIHKVRKWMDDNFINFYHYQEIGFGEIQCCDESIDMPCVIADTLQKKNVKDLFWRIGHHSQKIWVCSTNGSDVQEAVHAVKMCVKQTKRLIKINLPAETMGDMMDELVADKGDVVGRSTSVRVSREGNDLAVFLTGTEGQLDSINNWFNSYVQNAGHLGNQILATKRLKETPAQYSDISFTQIEQCSKDVWDIARTLKSKHIETLKQQGLTMTYTENIGSVAQGMKPKSDYPDFTEVLSCIEHLRKIEIIEVHVNEKNIDRINGWCHEIATNMNNTACCVYVMEKGAVLAFHLSFDMLQGIKHQILVKDGQKKNQDPVHETQEKRRMQARNPEFDPKKQAENLQVYTTDEHIKVFVYKANILKLPVDCIVNAANDTLQHGGGVARVIARAAGRKLDLEGFDHLKRYGNVPAGQACVTTAGKLHYDCVIHAVGPRWSDYSPHSFEDVRTCEGILHSALTESFLAAENRGLTSIALPPISAALFAVPEEVCVYHYAKATIDYSRRNSPNALEEIHFIDINPRIVNRIQNMFTTLLRNRENPHYSTEKFVKTRNQDYSWDRNTDTLSKMKPTYYEIDGSHFFETDKCKLVIKKGDIMTVKAEAIVSIEDTEGSGRGKIAKLIYDAVDGNCRRYFQDDKKFIFVENTKPGDVYKTNGYGSGFEEILHAVVPYDIRNKKPDDRKDVIKQTLQNILEVLSEYRIESVVMCLIGAGAETKTDVKIAADALCQVYTQTTVEFIKPLKITLVSRMKETLDTVIETFGQHGLTKEASPGTHPPSVPPRPNKPPALEPGNVEVSMEEDCVICMDKITEIKQLKCGHVFDRDCIDQYFKVKKVCPTCGTICGIITGDQPEGTMDDNTEVWSHCAGYSGCGRITITYNFRNGHQGADHPNPGKWYKGISCNAYLPDNKDGREILEMLKIAWKRKVIFTIGNSPNTGEEGVITWNDIHFKTDPRPNTKFGYPDATYLDRVKDELAVKGITPKDIEYQ